MSRMHSLELFENVENVQRGEALMSIIMETLACPTIEYTLEEVVVNSLKRQGISSEKEAYLSLQQRAVLGIDALTASLLSRQSNEEEMERLSLARSTVLRFAEEHEGRPISVLSQAVYAYAIRGQGIITTYRNLGRGAKTAGGFLKAIYRGDELVIGASPKPTSHTIYEVDLIYGRVPTVTIAIGG
jgi:hypothetical protein